MMERVRLFLLAILAAFLFIMLAQYFLLSLSLIGDIAAFPFAQNLDPNSGSARRQKLRFTPQGTFQLAVFGDLHYGEGELSVQPKVSEPSLLRYAAENTRPFPLQTNLTIHS
jgi:hypothetical protein